MEPLIALRVESKRTAVVTTVVRTPVPNLPPLPPQDRGPLTPSEETARGDGGPKSQRKNRSVRTATDTLPQNVALTKSNEPIARALRRITRAIQIVLLRAAIRKDCRGISF